MARRTPPPSLIGSGLIPETFQREYAGYEDEYQNRLAGLGKDERNLFADYGFQGGVGPDGKVNFQVDPNSQHGLYQQLLQNIGGQLGRAKTEARGRNIGRAGLAKAREGLIRFMMSGEKTALLSNFNKNAAGIFGQRGGALSDRSRGFTDVEGKALDWWNQYGPEDIDAGMTPTDAAPAAPVAYGDSRDPTNAVARQAMGVGEEGYTPHSGPAGIPVLPPDGGYPAPFDPYAMSAPTRRRPGQSGGRPYQTL